MDLRHPLEPLDRPDSLAFAVIAALAGVAGLAIAVLILASGLDGRRVPVALVAGACGLFAFTIARRLFTNRTPRKDGHLVSPWCTLAVGMLCLVVAIANVLLNRSSESTWLLVPGATALVFAWRQLRRSRKHSSAVP
jgi:hypothetical protein